MIAKMSKYNFVLYAEQSDDFIGRLRELGLVDITTSGWEPSEEDRELVLKIEALAKVHLYLNEYKGETGHESKGSVEPFESSAAAYEFAMETMQRATAIRAEIVRLEKSADELRPWGSFSMESVKALNESGVILRYFLANRSIFEKSLAEWESQYTVSLINEINGYCYFVVVAEVGAEVAIDAQEMKAPVADIGDVDRQTSEQQTLLKGLDDSFNRMVGCEAQIKEYDSELKERLENAQVTATSEKQADGYLSIMEGWAEEKTSDKVDALLEEYTNVIYLKSRPTPEDNVPVKLRNNRFSRSFEVVGDMYARPKYGTMDLTAFCAPFYMFFFAICLNDAGYGLILALGGLFAMLKSDSDMMRNASKFAAMCGVASVLFGLSCGSVFGVSLAGYFPSVPFIDFEAQFFTIAIAIGVIHIILGMILRVVMTASYMGVRYALAPLGWLLIVIAGALTVGLPMLDSTWVIPHFTASSPLFYGVVGVGAFMMFFLNSPGKNPFLNFAVGLWDTYNNVSGILGDVLSYIRLFAIGLAGGMLATVFNDLAVNFAGDNNIFVKLLIMIPILLLGHGINVMMSLISSFVHPMRLTFVEFYKNSGFEIAPRNFNPLQKNK